MFSFHSFNAAIIAVLTLTWYTPMISAAPDLTGQARKFVAEHEARFRPLETAAGITWWNANVSGKDEDFKKKEEAEKRMNEALANRGRFKQLKQLHDKRKDIKDPIVRRTIEVLYLLYLEKQVKPDLLNKIVARSNAVEKAFNVFRAKVDGKEMTDSEVRRILKQSKNSDRRKAVWQGSKRVGAAVEADLKELVKLRNQAARQLGFKNYHQMKLYLNEQDSDQLIKLFNELDELTREPFKQAKAEIDAKLAQNCGVAVDELMPWHYHDPFFQESPAVFAASLDTPYLKADILKLCREFYAGMGLPVEDVLARSDLYEKKGKSPHAFCTDITRQGDDVRVLANIVPSEYWTGTMLHELGHAVYSSKNIPAKLPYTLRTDSHILATEGVAMLFERFSKQRAWLEGMGVKVADGKAFDEAAAKIQRIQLLIFSRWCQVMLRFEKAMYENPNQDLNKLWWDLVEKYQLVRRPPRRSAPDYASKIHIVSAPVYYHNYMMGQLFASQVHHTISKEVLKQPPGQASYIGRKEVGDFMKKRVFGPGRSVSWNQLTKSITGSELQAKAFAADFRGK